MASQDSIIHKKLTALKQSKFRSKFKISQKDRDYITTKGLETIEEHAVQFINTRVAPDFPKNDGKQTPMRGHPVFIAQHATATCWRGCISKWHGIEKGRALNEKEVDFVVALIMGWIDLHLYLKGVMSDLQLRHINRWFRFRLLSLNHCFAIPPQRVALRASSHPFDFQIFKVIIYSLIPIS